LNGDENLCNLLIVIDGGLSRIMIFDDFINTVIICEGFKIDLRP
jgi:hypothetical protein